MAARFPDWLLSFHTSTGCERIPADLDGSSFKPGPVGNRADPDVLRCHLWVRERQNGVPLSPAR
jgi:hypothetical protein